MVKFPWHGDTPSESCLKAESGIALLPELRPGSKRPADLRRLFLCDLPALRHAAGIFRRTRNWIMTPAKGGIMPLWTVRSETSEIKVTCGRCDPPGNLGNRSHFSCYPVLQYLGWGKQMCVSVVASFALLWRRHEPLFCRPFI